jgi:hypothetical protein
VPILETSLRYLPAVDAEPLLGDAFPTLPHCLAGCCHGDQPTRRVSGCNIKQSRSVSICS